MCENVNPNTCPWTVSGSVTMLVCTRQGGIDAKKALLSGTTRKAKHGQDLYGSGASDKHQSCSPANSECFDHHWVLTMQVLC